MQKVRKMRRHLRVCLRKGEVTLFFTAMQLKFKKESKLMVESETEEVCYACIGAYEKLGLTIRMLQCEQCCIMEGA